MDTVPTPPAPPAPSVAATSEDKTAAILAYVTFIGFIVAIIINNGKKTKLGAYHLRQALGLFLTLFVCAFVNIIPLLGQLVYLCVLLCVFVFAIMGLISAVNGQMKPVPILGEKYQKWFGTAFE